MVKKKDNGFTKISEFFEDNQIVRILAIGGILVFVWYYLSVILTEEYGFLQNVSDWGVDQGVSALLWGIIFVIFSILIIVYPLQNSVRSEKLDSFYKILIGFPLGFLFYILFFWQWSSHLPFFNFYHSTDPLVITFGDKVLHFLGSLIVVLIAVKWIPRYTTIIIVFFVINSFELFELIFIVNFSGLYEINYEILPIIDLLLEEFQQLFTALIPISEIQDQLMHELIDIVPDIIANTLGVIVGYFFSKKLIEKEEGKQKKKKKKKK